MTTALTLMQDQLRDLLSQVQHIEDTLEGQEGNPLQEHRIGNQAIGEMHLNVPDGSAGDVLGSDGAGQLEWVGLGSVGAITMLDNCETENWGQTDGAIAEIVDSVNYVEGAGSLNLGKNNSHERARYFKFISVDATDKSLYVYLYVKDKTELKVTNSIDIWLYAPDVNNRFYLVYDRADIQDVDNDGTSGWNKLGGDVSVGWSEIGSPDIADIVTIFLLIYSPLTADTIALGNIKMDFWHLDDGAASGAELVGVETDLITESSGTDVQAILEDFNDALKAENYVLVRDVKSANTSGGDFTSGAWRVRVINEETVDTDGLVSLPGSNIIRLAAGTYRCRISAPAHECNRHKIRLWDTTAGAVIAYGSSEYSASASGYAQTRSVLSARFTLSEQSDLRVEHRCQTTKNIAGFGLESNFGVEEVYTIAEFWKVG